MKPKTWLYSSCGVALEIYGANGSEDFLWGIFLM